MGRPTKKENIWQDISSAPDKLIYVSVDGKDDGQLAVYKKTRQFNRKDKKWEVIGYYVDNVTWQPLSYKPLFWRDVC